MNDTATRVPDTLEGWRQLTLHTLCALHACRATARDGEDPVVGQADLLHGAQLQLRGALKMRDFHRRRIPTRGLDAVLLPAELKDKLEKVGCRASAAPVLLARRTRDTNTCASMHTSA